MMNTLKHFIRSVSGYNRLKFRSTCKRLGLSLDYQKNKESATILYNVFLQREYADYFPFYEAATVVDIGGHLGYFSLFASRNLDEKAQIFTYEPHPKNFNLLEENLRKNHCKRVKFFQKGIGSRRERKTLFEHANYNHSMIDENQSSVEIEVISLADVFEDNNLSTIDFLKIDCEGAEYEILLNTPSSVFRNIFTISMEFHDLKQKGYRPQQLVEKLVEEGFDIKTYTFSSSFSGSNFGHIIASKKYMT